MSIPTADLRALVVEWRKRQFNYESAGDAGCDFTAAAYREAADELHALIVKAEAQVGDAEAERDALRNEVDSLQALLDDGGEEVSASLYDKVRAERDTANERIAAVLELCDKVERKVPREKYSDTNPVILSMYAFIQGIRAALGASPAPPKEGPQNVAVPAQAEQTLERVSDDPLTFRYTATKTEGTL